jgi:hypothetical protein
MDIGVAIDIFIIYCKLKPLLKTRCIAAVFLKKWNLLRILEADHIATFGPGVMNYGQL